MRLRLSRAARQDLLEIARYIALDDPVAARRWVRALRARVHKLARHPRAGRRVPELAHDELREVLADNYRIIYLIRAKELVVLRFLEGHRKLQLDPDDGA